MSNPFNLPNPGVDPDWWRQAEQFATERYELPCSATFYGSSLGNQLQDICNQQQSPQEKWIFLATFKLAQLKPNSSIARDAAGVLLGFLGLGGLADAVIGNEVGGILGGIGGGTDAAVESVAGVGRSVLGTIEGTTRGATDAITQVSTAALLALDDTGQRAVNNTANIAQQILGVLDGSNRSALDTILGLFGKSSGAIDDLLRRGSGLFEALTGKAIDSIEDLLRETFKNQDGILGKIGDTLILNLQGATDANERTAGKIADALDAEVQQARENSEAITEGLRDSIDRITNSSESALAITRDTLTATSGQQAAATREGSEQVAGAIDSGLAGVSGPLSDIVGDAKGLSPEVMRDRINAAFDAVARQGNCPADFSEFLSDFIDKLTTEWNPTTPLVHILGQVQLITSIFGPALQVLGNCLAQAAARAAPTALPDVSEIREQLRRRIIGIPEANDLLASQGYNLDRAANLLATRNTVPDVGFVQTWFLRGFINSDQAITKLADNGYTGEDIENLLKMAFFIPPPQDLITMAVREVFTPAVAARFGQFDDFPQPFADFAAQQGISEEWAQRYWAAHWSLPSPQQGFEMFQRDVIDRKDLDLLLKALDIMPFWRERLTQIAYRPVTRVDIRRMHALGLLTREEMTTRYRYMGFSPQDADFMSTFTERLNAPKGEKDVEELEGATRGTVLRLYRRGAITEEQARAVLTEMGTGERAINVLLTNERLALELEQREERTALILEQAKAGQISFDDAQDQLARIGLTSTELSTALAKLERMRAQRTKIPSRGELEKLYAGGLVNDLEFSTTMLRLGYSLFWTERFLRQAQAAKAGE